MNNKQKFYSQLQNLYVGAKLDGKGGIAKLLQFKCQYFTQIKPLIESEIKKYFPDQSDAGLAELYDKLYTFFSSYITDGGSIYFSDTPAYKNVYAKVYFDTYDTALFYKTKDLYYVKSQIMYQTIENLTFNIEDKTSGVYFDFDASDYIPTNNNAKEKVLILFTGIKNFKLQFKVIEQSQLESELKSTIVDSKQPEQLKNCDNAEQYIIKINKNDIFSDYKSFYAINFLKNEKCRKAVITFCTQNEVIIKEDIVLRAINIYKKQNEVDYFIHKNAKGFLTEQFNLFIYNYLSSDVESLLEQKRLNNIRKIKQIAFTIIDYIAKFEDELKAIWNKPKFVRNIQYIVTLDKLVAKNFNLEKLLTHKGIEAQIKEWINLGIVSTNFSVNDINNKDISNKSKYQYLPFDTKHFDTEIKYSILTLFDNFDEECNGVLIKSENYQALNTILPKYKEQIDLIHIDPPYNAKHSEIYYSNNYKNSSWLSMIENRLQIAKYYMSRDSCLMIHIDEYEYERLKLLLDTLELDNLGTIIWDKRNPMGGSNRIANQHEYIICYSKGQIKLMSNKLHGKLILDKAKTLIKHNNDTINESVRLLFKEWITQQESFAGGEKVFSEIDNEGRVYSTTHMGAPEYRTDKKFFVPLIHPITGNPCPVPANGWSNTPEFMKTLLENNEIVFGVDETTQPRRKSYLDDKLLSECSSIIYNGSKGKREIDALGLKFAYNHPTNLYETLLFSIQNPNGYIMDFFAGSGTTAHAIINLNRQEKNGNRKYILTEMGEHFHSALLPRIKKVIYAKKWKEGQAQDNDGISHLIKYYALEQYEDVLDKSVYSGLLTQQVTNLHNYLLNYDFSNHEKLAFDGLSIDYTNEFNSIQYSFTKIYPDIDLWETLSNFYGYKIKKYHNENKVTFVSHDGSEITLDKNQITFDNMPELKQLIWW